MKPKVIKNYNFPVNKKEMPFGPGSEAGVLIDINAGWRSYRPLIDYDKCNYCLRCWLLCPDGVISKKKEELEFDYDYCKGCGICAYECPKEAIVMVKEGESK